MSVKRRCGGARGRRRQESCVWMCDDGTSLLQRRTTEPVRRQTQSRAEIGEVHEADDVNEFDLLLVGDLGHAREWEQQWWIFSFFFNLWSLTFWLFTLSPNIFKMCKTFSWFRWDKHIHIRTSHFGLTHCLQTFVFSFK